MKLQGRELTQGMVGADVALLQQELALLGYAIPANETQERVFQDGTIKAVMAFQASMNLPQSGTVDEKTAALINQQVDKVAPQEFALHGQVTQNDGTPLTDGRVSAFDQAAQSGKEVPLGDSALDGNGDYQIAYTRDQLSDPSQIAANLLVVIYDSNGDALVSVGPIANAPADLTINVLVPAAPVTPPPPATYVVHGQAAYGDGQPVLSGTARAFQVSGAASLFLGEASLSAQNKGSYSISYLAPGLSAFSLVVRLYDANGELLTASDALEGAPDLTVNLSVANAANGLLYAVSGRVSSAERAGVGGLRVQVVDKYVGGDLPLVEGTTDSLGSYTLQYPLARVQERGKDTPDIQVQVYNGQTFVAASDVSYNASPSEILHVVVPGAAASTLASEHETLTSDLAAHYTGALGALKETSGQQDITYLANKSGWDARAVALAALADQFSAAASNGAATIAPAYFYALFRAGIPANDDTLYLLDGATLGAVWTSAAAQGVIPPASSDAISDVVKRFQTISVAKLQTAPALTGPSSMQELLAASNLDADQQAAFASAYVAHRTDPTALWAAVTTALGADTSARLQLDGKLSFLTLNNAPLMQKLHAQSGIPALTDPLQLAQSGYHRASAWASLLTSDVPVPKEIPGDTPDAQRANYAAYLAAQVRISYPTAAVAQMIKSGDLPLPDAPQGVPDQVHAFLTDHQGKFEIGAQPIEQYLASSGLALDADTLAQIKRVQRVYQITPNDDAMIGLLANRLDAAYHVVQIDKATFLELYQDQMGGAQAAEQTYDKAVQVYNAVLNMTIGFLTSRNGIPLGGAQLITSASDSADSAQVLQPFPNLLFAQAASSVLAYPTLEGLVGSMDYCDCEDWRSNTSPAAYLVDLLDFIDQPAADAGKENPQAVLFERRPDIPHLPLTGENTTTALPYIDIVNETLEYFVANATQPFSLTHYAGHDTGDADSADLLASPQFVIDAAYTTLLSECFPMPLPFHQPLENLRRYFDKFQVPLTLAMERLSKASALERGTNTYGWRDILMETITLSREEHAILTDSSAVPLWQMYGYPSGTPDADVIDDLSNAKQFTRRVGVTYMDIAAILETCFVNPDSVLVPKLQRLGVSFAALKALNDATGSATQAAADAAFDALLAAQASPPVPAEYGGDIKAWVRDPANYARIMGLITLADPTGSDNPCSFDDLEFRHAQPISSPTDTSTRLNAVEFVRLLRFIRLWKKLGWTIEQSDAAICALLRADATPLAAADIDTLAKLDGGFLTLLPRIGLLTRVMAALKLTVKRDLLPLLACWSEIGTHGSSALYRQLFLNPALLKQDAAFADNGVGEFLTDATETVAAHAEALRTAFNLTSDEYNRIITALGYDAATPLTLAKISAIFRRGYLARSLRLSVREFLLFCGLTALDPFTLPDATLISTNWSAPDILRLIKLAQNLRARGLPSTAALYLIWNQDLSGQSAPDPAQVREFARTLRGDYADIEVQFAATADPNGDIAQARMILVYTQADSDTFFALLDNTLVISAPYTSPTPALDPAITAIDGALSYDDLLHLLSHTGLLDGATRSALENVAGVSADFTAAVDQLYFSSEDAKGSFFSRFPELQPLYAAYVASTDTLANKRAALLLALQPVLSRERKSQQAQQRLTAAAGVDLGFTQALLDSPSAPYPIHAAGHSDQAGLNDALALETPGLTVQFFYADAASGNANLTVAASATLDYAPAGGSPLPSNPTAGNAISGIWSGAVETSDAGYFNVIVETDSGASVTLSLDGADVPLLAQNGTLWRNSGALQLKGAMLHPIVLTVNKVTTTVRVQWETPKQPRALIPASALYPQALLDTFGDLYARFFKAASLAVGLHLSANELAHFALDADNQIGADGWLNVLPVSGSASAPAALLTPLETLLDFARIKAALSPNDEQVLTILQDPTTATATDDSPLFTLARWDCASLSALVTQFGGAIADLTHLTLFSRVYDAFGLIQNMGIGASALIAAVTNAPTSATVNALQAALHTRYEVADWRTLVQPINDDLRGLQRDALVAYILHHLRSTPATAQIDTADKLFEYFLMDVQMEPCMQTSRIRHALSSVQLFIERCIMNLEPRVSPASVKPEQWDWMKRYRVWQANREVFLHPENWAEPELRLNKSPFFKEIESELLQNDITEDSAEIALLNYLTKLEEVAKLEPCGVFHIPAIGNAAEIDHVIARTAGAQRKYYYRRCEGGSWTAWEDTKLSIEDDPVIPVVWNDRLLVFWLRILRQGLTDASQVEASSSNGKGFANLSLGEVKTDAKTGAAANAQITVSAILCWSEYYNGKWQPAKTSDPTHPTKLETISPADFDRSALELYSRTEDDTLLIGISGLGGSWFRLYNTHSLPVPAEDDTASSVTSFIYNRWRWDTGDFTGDLSFEYYDPNTDADLDRDILTPQLPFTLIIPNHPVTDTWDAPFFYEDKRHVFWVTTSEAPIWIKDYQGYAVFVPGVYTVNKLIPPMVLPRAPYTPPRPLVWVDGGPGTPDVVNPAALRHFVSEDAYIRNAVTVSPNVQYNGQQIGLTGAASAFEFER